MVAAMTDNGVLLAVTAIIPARYDSTRFPGKALADIAGKTLIRRVYERVALAAAVSRVIVATDDERIMREVTSFGGEAVITSTSHSSGTDRVAEAAGTVGGDVIVNVQGDEPLINPEVVNAVCGLVVSDASIRCATAASPIHDRDEYENPNSVKVVIDRQGRALYFSRAPIPWYREDPFSGALLHQGIYCFRREALEEYTQLEETALERAEKLEQLRMLEHGWHIGVVVTDHRSVGVDTPEDAAEVSRLVAAACGANS